MIIYIIRRLFYIVIMFWILSMVSFMVIQLPPGNFLSSQIVRLEAEGTQVSDAEIAALEAYYGLKDNKFIESKFENFEMKGNDEYPYSRDKICDS